MDVNSHRVALQKFKEHSASEKDAADVAHIKNVQATQSLMQISDVVVVPPATGGLTAPEGIHWPAAAVQGAGKSQHRVSVLVAEAAVTNILSLPAHGVLSQKLLHQVRGAVLMQVALPDPVLVMYPVAPRSVYKAKQTMISYAASAFGATLMAAVGAKEEHDSDDSSGSEDD